MSVLCFRFLLHAAVNIQEMIWIGVDDVIRIPLALSYVGVSFDWFFGIADAAALFWLGVLFPRLVRHLIIISPLTMDAAEMEIDVI